MLESEGASKPHPTLTRRSARTAPRRSPGCLSDQFATEREFALLSRFGRRLGTRVDVARSASPFEVAGVGVGGLTVDVGVEPTLPIRLTPIPTTCRAAMIHPR